MEKTVRFPNSAVEDRTEVAYATVPFKQGEWDGSDPLEIVDEAGSLIPEAWVYPFGKRYADGTYRYGALMVRLTVEGRAQTIVTVQDATRTLTEPIFAFSRNLVATAPLAIHFGTIIEGRQSAFTFSNWKTLESNGMRRVYESVGRLGDFVANLKLYVFNDQDLIKWELDVTGSNPSNTLLTYAFDELHLLVTSPGHFLNIRGAAGRGVQMLDPFRHYKLMRGAQGFFGDGQRQSYYGELVTVAGSATAAQSAAAALSFPMWGMSQDWVECGEAFGACGVVPETPVELPTGGFEAVFKKYVKVWRLMNRSEGNPWDDYPEGLTKFPGQTGAQPDFGIIEQWEVLYTGMAEIVESIRFLATEDAKRPGHYLELDGSPVTHKGHPRWVTWNGKTHFSFSVSQDRLGKTDPGQLSFTNAWKGKDWEHFSSNLLYAASLLTGSHQLRDQQRVEAESFLAGHTVPSEFPNWSTNARGAPRGFGRPHLTLLHHDTVLDNVAILDKMMDRFHQVVKNGWSGARNSPVRIWSVVVDPRVFVNLQPGWVPWNEHLGWIGMYALWLATNKDPEVEQIMVAWGNSIVNWGWRILPGNQINVGGAVKWNQGGAPITAKQFSNPLFWRQASSLTQWGMAVLSFAAGSPLFDSTTRSRAQAIWDILVSRRVANYEPIQDPFDSFGKWSAL